MKYKIAQRTVLMLLVMLFALCLLSGTLAWYRQIKMNFGTASVSGMIRMNYFERGSGTADDPFIIHTPEHLYNLAWLQDLGYFNNSKAPYYFKLCDGGSSCTYPVKTEGREYTTTTAADGTTTTTISALKMNYDNETRAIPPIGTETYPFIGYFDGNGQTIKNVTITTESGSWWEKPSAGSLTTSDISTGFFGKIATTVTAGNPAVYNFYLENPTITVGSSSSTQYVGYIAGYVNSITNGTRTAGTDGTFTTTTKTTPISDVYVNNCTMDIGNTAKSEYGLIGYVGTIDGSNAPTTLIDSSEAVGDDYSFALNASNFYTFLSGYSSYSSTTLARRALTITSAGATTATASASGYLSSALAINSSIPVANDTLSGDFLVGQYPDISKYSSWDNNTYSFSEVGFYPTTSSGTTSSSSSSGTTLSVQLQSPTYLADLYSSYTSANPISTTILKKDSSGNIVTGSNSAYSSISTKYNINNIDLVGGLLFKDTYIYMAGYMNGTSAATLGNTFHPSDNARCGILLYIKNTSDSSDSTALGNFAFEYYGYGNNSGGATPQFNKGGGSGVTFSTLGAASSGSGTSTNPYIYTLLNMTKAQVKKACYCGLDVDGKIVATYTTSGVATYYTGKSDSDVKTFVLLLSCSNGQIAIENLEFYYKAPSGSGGSSTDIPKTSISSSPLLTQMDYRSSGSVINSSLLLNYAGSANVSVNFTNRDTTDTSIIPASDTVTTGYYTINVTSTSAMELQVLLCDNDNLKTPADFPYAYVLYYNGKLVTNGSFNYWRSSKVHSLGSTSSS